MNAGTATATPTPSLAARWRAACERIPTAFLLVLARIGMAATFWQSGQTKIEGLVIDLAGGPWTLGWPRLSDSAVGLFRDEYRLPLLPAEWAAPLAATAEHLLPVLLVIGLATRSAAAALLAMTLVIEVLVYPWAYPVHATWALALLLLVKHGAGAWSLDALLMRRGQR